MSTTTQAALGGWDESVAQRLLDAAVCPLCGEYLASGCCARCGADLRGPEGLELWSASSAAASAIRNRAALLGRVPRLAPAADSGSGTGVQNPQATMPASPPPPGISAAGPLRQPPRSSATVQSVLAIAGAGLFAIAALVFTFLNPDLTDRVIRSISVGLVTLVFLGGAWALARRGLQFSAETVGALGLVFIALDVYSVAQISTTASDAWLIAAAATALAAIVMLLAGRLSRLRVWSWGGAVGLALVPAMAGYAAGSIYLAAFAHVAAAMLAAGLLVAWPHIARRSLTALQIIAVVSAAPLAVYGVAWSENGVAALLGISVVFALIAAHAIFASRHPLSGWWSLVAGGATSAALVLAVVSPIGQTSGEWGQAAFPTAAALALAVAAIAPLPRTVSRVVFAAGGVIVLAVTALPSTLYAALSAVQTVTAVSRGAGAGVRASAWDWAALIGMVGIAAGLALFGGLVRDRRDQNQRLRAFAARTDVAGVLAAGISVLLFGCAHLAPLPARILVVLGAAGITAIVLSIPQLRSRIRPTVRVVLILGIHAAILVGLVISWLDPRNAPLAGAGVVTALALAGRALPAGSRFFHVGTGFAYALVCLAQALAQTAPGSIVVLCLVTTAALVVAIVATFVSRVTARDWYAVLIVASVPFLIGIVQVVFERSAWTALSSALMFALALSLVLTRRPGLNIVLRTAAAALLVPTVAVVVVCLGAQLLAVSASPVTLPVIAAIVAFVLPSTTLIRDALRRNGLPADAATAARAAIEASALLTGAIATGLALAREAAGLGTTFLVLVLLGVGAAASALFARRRYGWWVAGAAFTGALWCVWALNGVDLPEAYVLPPALAAVATAVALTARTAHRRRFDARGLYAAGLGAALVPSLLLLVLGASDARIPGADGNLAAPWRTIGLLAAGGVLLAAASWFAPSARNPRRRRLAALAPATFAAGAFAALAGPVQGIRFGLGADLPMLHGAGLLLVCFGMSSGAALILVGAARGIRARAAEGSRVRASRWMFAPPVLALSVGTWCAIERDWASIWLMWALMIALLGLMLAAAVPAGRASLPPVWFLFAAAFVTAVVAWSPRDLRVEWFSLPLGAFLLLAGIRALRGAQADGGAGIDAWPWAQRGSWALLAPGLITMMSASIIATFTDPLTWRAILVMILALASIMVGAGARLAAPFLIGMLVLPIENVFVFAVQIGRGIESMPWWITLAVIGAVLLIIAVTYERRSGEAGGVVARIRDLR